MRENNIYLDREEQDTVFYDSKPFIKIYLYKGIIQNITTAMLVALLHYYWHTYFSTIEIYFLFSLCILKSVILVWKWWL